MNTSTYRHHKTNIIALFTIIRRVSAWVGIICLCLCTYSGAYSLDTLPDQQGKYSKSEQFIANLRKDLAQRQKKIRDRELEEKNEKLKEEKNKKREEDKQKKLKEEKNKKREEDKQKKLKEEKNKKREEEKNKKLEEDKQKKLREEKNKKLKEDKNKKREEDKQKKLREEKNKKLEEEKKNKTSIVDAVKSANKFLHLRGASKFNALSSNKGKNEEDAKSLESTLDADANTSQGRIFDIARKYSSRKSDISRSFNPFGTHRIANRHITPFIEGGFAYAMPVQRFNDKVPILNPKISLSQLSRGFIPMHIGFGIYPNKRLFSVALNYTFNYAFGSKTFRSAPVKMVQSVHTEVIGIQETPVTRLHELTIDGKWYFYEKVTQGVDLVKFYAGLEIGMAFGQVSSLYQINGALLRSNSGSFAQFEKKYAVVPYGKFAGKLGLLLRATRSIHLFTDLAVSYYLPVTQQVDYTLQPGEETIKRVLFLDKGRELLGKKNWKTTFSGSVLPNWSFGIRHVLGH